jgi:Outer membrane receptor proteins, mostly Fe transport
MKKLIFFFAAVFLLSFYAQSVLAQNTLKGVLLNENNNEKVAFANIGLYRMTDTTFISGAISDENGEFELKNIPNGNYDLKVTYIGFQNFSMKVQVPEMNDLGALKLVPGEMTLDEVVITEKKPLFSVEGEKSMYNVSEDPSVQTGNASDALQNAPGVEVDVEGNISLRGSTGIDVWINDKPSHLSEENLKTYLQQLPANSIDHIEVIANPSARYGSKSGNGVINIVTNAKIQKNEFVSFGVMASTQPFLAPYVSYVWANDKISLNAFVNTNFANWSVKNNGYSYAFADATQSDTITHITTNSSNKTNYLNAGAMLSLDYQIDSMNSLSVFAGGWPNKYSYSGSSQTYRREYIQAAGEFHYSSASDNKGNNLYGFGGLYYEHKFNNKGHKISVNGNANIMTNDDFLNQVRTFEEQSDMNKTYELSTQLSGISFDGGVDYVIPYSENGEISVGVQESYEPENCYNKYDSLAGGTYVNDEWRSYEAQTLDNEVDAYVTLEHRFGTFTIKPGVRAEYTTIRGTYKDTPDDNFDINYLNWRPSLHLSYRTKSMHNFTASYTRKVRTPGAKEITGKFFYDEDEFHSGNPDLASTFSNNIEAGWTKYFMKFGSVGLTGYYRNSVNDINDVSDVLYSDLWGRVVNYSQPMNVGMTSRAGGELNMTYRPNAMMNVRMYANLFNSHIETTYDKLGDEKIVNDMLCYSVRVNFWTKLWNKLEVHASGYYRSPSQTLFAQRKANYGVNCGLRADFFDRKMSVFVNAQDVFDWNRYDNTTSNPFFISYNSSKYSSRSVRVGFTFRFGKMELESKARQSGGGGTGMPAVE